MPATTTSPTFTVTNTDSSGEGSLAWAIAQANAYVGEEVPIITFDAGLANTALSYTPDTADSALSRDMKFETGADCPITLSLNTDVRSTACVTVGGGITLSGTLQVYGRLEMESGSRLIGMYTGAIQIAGNGVLSMQEATLEGRVTLLAGATVMGEGNFFTDRIPVSFDFREGPVNVYQALSMLPHSTFGEEEMYVMVSGQGSHDIHLLPLPDIFRGYVLEGGIYEGSTPRTLTMESGVSFYIMNGNSIEASLVCRGGNNIYCLDAENYYLESGFTLKSDGKIYLKSASYDLADSQVNCTLELSEGAVLTADGATFTAEQALIFRINEWDGTSAPDCACRILNCSFAENARITYKIDGFGGKVVSLADAMVNLPLPEGVSRVDIGMLHLGMGDEVTLPSELGAMTCSVLLAEGATLKCEAGVSLSESGAYGEPVLVMQDGSTLVAEGLTVSGTVSLAPGARILGDIHFEAGSRLKLLNWQGSAELLLTEVLADANWTADAPLMIEIGSSTFLMDGSTYLSGVSGAHELAKLPEEFGPYVVPSTGASFSDKLTVKEGVELLMEGTMSASSYLFEGNNVVRAAADSEVSELGCTYGGNSVLEAYNTRFDVTVRLSRDMTLLGDNITFAAEVPLMLYFAGEWDGSTAQLEEQLNAILVPVNNYTITRKDAALGISHVTLMQDAVLNAQSSPEGFSHLYFSFLEIISGVTLTVDGSASFNSYSTHVNGGTLVVNSGAKLGVVESDFNYILVSAGVNSGAPTDGTLIMDGADLNGTEIECHGGNLIMTNCRGEGTLFLTPSATHDGISISGCDLSQMTIELLQDSLLGVSTIDLSGNYWGTRDMDEITARITGYDSSIIVIDSILTSPPGEEAPFGLSADMQKENALRTGVTELTVSFEQDLDTAGIDKSLFHLRDNKGNEVQLLGLEAQGNEVTLRFAPLAEGNYHLQIDSALRSVEGATFVHNHALHYNCSPSTAAKVLLVDCRNTTAGQFNYFDIYFDRSMDASTLSAATIRVLDSRGKAHTIDRIVESRNQGRVFYRVYLGGSELHGTYTIVLKDSIRALDGYTLEGGYKHELKVFTPDLQVQMGETTPSGEPGKALSLAWTLTNNGDAISAASWVDELYLCTGPEWDESQALFLGRYTHTNESLASGEALSVQMNVMPEGLEPGTYYLFVRTNAGSHLYEDNQDNNLTAIGTPVQLELPRLTTGESHTSTLSSANEKLCYSFTAESSSTYCLSLGMSAGAMRVAEGHYPGAGESIGRLVEEDGQRKLYFSAEAGKSYYILAEPGAAGQYEARLEETPFELQSVSRYTLAAGQEASIHVFGACFSDATTFYLEGADGSRYLPQVEILSDMEALLTFNLPEGTEPGTEFTLRVEDPALTEALSLPRSLSVSGAEGAITLRFVSSQEQNVSSRVGFVWESQLEVENQSAFNVENAIVLVTSTTDSDALYYSYEDSRARDRSALLLNFGNADATTGVMTASETETQSFFVKNYRAGSEAIQAWVFWESSEIVLSEEQWKQLESALQPATCSNAEWSAWWAEMQPRIGTTEGDVVSFIYGMQAHVTATDSAKPGATLPELVEQVMESSVAFTPSYAVKGTLFDSETGKALANEELSVFRKDATDEWVLETVTRTDASGFYFAGCLQAGETYTIVANGAWDLDRDGQADTELPEFTVSAEDVQMDAYVQPPIDESEYDSHSDYRYATGSDGTCYRLWNMNDMAVFAYKGEDGVWHRYVFATEFNPTMHMEWSEALQALVIAWTEEGQLCYRTGHFIGETMRWGDISTTPLTEDVELLGFRTDESGNATFICVEGAGDIRLVQKSLVEDLPHALSESLCALTDRSGTLTSGQVYDKSFNVELPSFLTSLLSAADFSLGGGFAVQSGVEQTAENKYSLSVSANGHVEGGVGGIYFEAKLDTKQSITYTVAPVEEQKTYILPSWKPTSAVMTGKIGYKKSFDLMEALGKFCGGADTVMGKLNGLLKKLDVHINMELDLSATLRYPLQGTKSATLEFEGNAELDIAAKGAGVNGKFRVTYPIEFYAGSWSVKGTPEAEFHGSVTLTTPKIKIPFFEEGAFTLVVSMNSDGDWEVTTKWHESKDSDDEPLIELTAEGNSIEVNPNTAKVSITTLNGNKIEDLPPLSFGGSGSKLYNVKVQDYGDARLLFSASVVKKSCNLQDGQSLSLDEAYDLVHQGYIETSMQTAILDLRNKQCIPLTANNFWYRNATGYTGAVSAEGIEGQEADELVDLSTGVVDMALQEFDGRMYMAWVTVASGVNQLFIAELEGETWGTPTLISESAKYMDSCQLAQEGGSLIVSVEADDPKGLISSRTQRYMLQQDGNWREMADESAADAQDLASAIREKSDLTPWTWLSDAKSAALQELARLLALRQDYDALESMDPNEIYGPVGSGSANWIGAQTMDFQIACENIAKDNIAHAALVTITQQLDEALDWSTFTLGTMMLGGQYITEAEGLQRYQGRLDMTDTLGVMVDVEAGIDLDTGMVTWSFTAIDPETGRVVSDPFKGLLAPNYNPPEGDGYVNYTVKPRDTVASGTQFKAEADIVFDFNEAIETPTLEYTLDIDTPEATVLALPATGSGRYIQVEWSGADAHSGVAGYNVYVSVDGGEWQLWRNNIAATSALYAAEDGEHRYAFYATATDYAGNEEQPGTTAAEAETTHRHSTTPLTASCGLQLTGNELTLTLQFSHAPKGTAGWESEPGPDWAELIRVPGVDLTAGSFSYEAQSHTLTWLGSVDAESLYAAVDVQLIGSIADKAGNSLMPLAPSFAQEASLNLTPTDRISNASPTWADIDGDGSADLLAGVTTADGKGVVRLYTNGSDGLSQTYSYALQEDGSLLTVEGGVVSVGLHDVNGDGRAELVLGQADGSVTWYSATESGTWTGGDPLTCLVIDKPASVKVDSYASIEFADLDGDGFTDLLIGTGEGCVAWYRGNAEGHFLVGDFLYDAQGIIMTNARTDVSVTDVDGDGCADLILSSGSQLVYYRNFGKTGTPLFGEGVVISGPELPDNNESLSIDVADIDGDGIDDILLGLSDGSITNHLGSGQQQQLAGVTIETDRPAAPQNLSATTGTGGNTTFTWEAVEGISGYLLRYEPEGGEAVEIYVRPSLKGQETLRYTLPLADGRYNWSVRSIAADGARSLMGGGNSFVADATAPEQPSITSTASVAGGWASMKWEAVSDPSGVSYELRYRAEGSQNWTFIRTDHADLTLPLELPNGQYTWQLRAVDGLGNASVWSDEQSFTIDSSSPSLQHTWAQGIVLDTQGNVVSGFNDLGKTGDVDSSLCWAAVAGNMLQWWQQRYNTTGAISSTTVPHDAEGIYESLISNWENTAGLAAYGCIWWLSGRANDAAYTDYHSRHYTGNSDAGGHYNQFYTAENVTDRVTTVNARGESADELAEQLASAYRLGGICALNIYEERLESGFIGGHALTLWGVTQEAASGRLTAIHVTDSDDGLEGVRTLEVYYDSSGYYRIAAPSDSELNGYYIGSYTTLKAFTGKDVVAPEIAATVRRREYLDGELMRVTFALGSSEEGSRLSFEINGETYTPAADGSLTLVLSEGEHSYRVTATDSSGNSAVYEGSLKGDITTPALPVPEVVVAGSSATLRWEPVADASGVTYELRYRKSGESEYTTTTLTESSCELSALAEGAYEWALRAVDGLGNASAWVEGASFLVGEGADKLRMQTAPILTKSSNGKVKATLSWEGEEGVDTYYTLVVDGKTVVKNKKNITSWKGSLKGDEHRYELTAKAKDGTVKASLSGSFRYDATAPVLKLQAPALSKAGEGLVSATFSWSGHEEGLVYTLTVDKDKEPGYRGTNPTPTLILEDGKHSYTLTATDAMGNVSKTVKGSFSFDSTAPALSVKPYKLTLDKKNEEVTSATLSWKGESGCRYTIEVDGEVQVSGSTKTSYRIVNDGRAHRYTITATDKSGNTTRWEDTRALSYDTTAPVLTALTHRMELADTTEGSPVTTLSWQGESDSLLTYTIKVDGKTIKDAAITHDGEGGYSYTHTTPLKSGKHRYEITATDWAGNKVTYKGKLYEFTTPKLSVSKPKLAKVMETVTASNGKTGKVVVAGKVTTTLTWKGETGAGYTLFIDGEEVSAATVTEKKGSYTYRDTLRDGAHSYRIVATRTDSAGTTTYSVAEGLFTYDTTAPEFLLGSLSGSVVSGKKGAADKVKATLSWAGEDGVSYSIKLGKKTVYSGKGTSRSYTFEQSGAEGHVLTITAKDKSGNVSTYTATLHVGVSENGEAVLSWGAFSGESTPGIPENAQALTWQATDTAGLPSSWSSAESQSAGYGRYSFTLEEARQLDVKLTGLAGDAEVVLSRADGTGRLALSAYAATGLDHELSLSAGTYYLQVSGVDGAGLGDYTLDLELEASGKKKAFAQATLASLA